MEIQSLSSLVREHKELHAGLHRAIRHGGNIGAAAEDVLEVLHEHFDREEKYVIPPLSVLAGLSQGKAPPGMEKVLPAVEGLRRELPVMLEEHKKLVSALGKLIEVAKRENRPEHVKFAEALIWHAKSEEEVLYPAALLVGEYLSLKLGKPWALT